MLVSAGISYDEGLVAIFQEAATASWGTPTPPTPPQTPTPPTPLERKTRVEDSGRRLDRWIVEG